MCGISVHDCRQRLLQSPRAVELADQSPRGRIQFCREGQPVLESECQVLRLPAASREARVLGDDGVMDDAQSPLEELVIRVELGQPVASRTASSRVARRAEGPRAAVAAPPASRPPRRSACEGPGTHSRGARSPARGNTRAIDRAPRRRRSGWSRRSRFHTVAVSIGSSVEVWSRNASHLEPSSQLRGRSAGSSGLSDQAIRTEAKALGASVAGMPSHDMLGYGVPGMPLSRNRYALSGETTYGGLATTRSNCSPPTGSKKLPARVSTLSAPLSAALNAA